MAQQEHAHKSNRSTEEANQDRVPGAPHKTREELNAEMDDILDSIDEALEGVNAEQFVAQYVQKGGE